MMENRQSSCPNNYRMSSVQNSVSMNRVTVSSSVSSAAAMQKPCKADLMNKINQHSFAMNEANLFLDTHPFDQEALTYFQKHRDLRVEAVKEYAKYYAPLCIDYAVCDKTPWSWVNEPWPWEGVEC